MIAKEIKLLAALVVVCCASYAEVAGQQPAVPRELGKIVYDGDMAALLANVAETFNVTIGFETVPQQPKARIKIEAANATLEDVLNVIVQAAPGYKWRTEDGFIDVYPEKASSPLLDTVVNDFQISNADWTRASEALINLLEVQTEINSMQLSRRDFSNTTRRANAEQFSLSLRNVTLRRALHEITKKSGGGFWVFQRYGNGGRLFSVSHAG